MRALVLVALLALAAPAAAQHPVSAEDKLQLARLLVGEADFHQADYAPISWVLLKRWRMYQHKRPEVTFAEFCTMYSAALRSSSPRARAIQALSWGEAPGRWGGRRWLRVQAWVERWAAGEVRDPCPQALQWGGTMDRPAAHWRPVNCGRTRNIFYGTTRQRHSS